MRRFRFDTLTGGKKGLDGRGLRETKVKTMTNLITQCELRSFTLAELRVLHQELLILLAETAYGTASRRNCLASLENTIREINARLGCQWKLDAGL